MVTRTESIKIIIFQCWTVWTLCEINNRCYWRIEVNKQKWISSKIFFRFTVWPTHPKCINDSYKRSKSGAVSVYLKQFLLCQSNLWRNKQNKVKIYTDMDYLFTKDKNMGPSDIKHEIFDESTANFLVSFSEAFFNQFLKYTRNLPTWI